MKTAVAEQAASVINEAIKPYAEKAQGLHDYASAIVELERKKAELNTPAAEKGNTFARYTRALALGKGDPDRAAFEAGRAWGTEDSVVKALKNWREDKALTAGNPSGAGSVIPPAVAAEFIELLRGRAVVRSIARVFPMPNGNLQFRKQTAAATAAYSAESTNITASQLEVGTVNLSFKKLTALSPVSNSLLRFGAPEIDAMVREDLLAVMALKEDAAFLAGNGLSNMPLGIFGRVNAANVFADAGTTFAQQLADYTKAIKLLEEGDVDVNEDNGYFIVAPRVFWGIFGTVGTNTDGPFMAGLQLPEPRLLGHRILKTTQAKKAFAGGDATESTLGSTADRIYFVHAPSLVIGDSMNLQVAAFDGGAYYNGSSVVSGVSLDETVIRVISEHDFGMRHD
ncbi:MAG: phage major capsid protein, partial [Planctomycetia bacterium]|nr:phage major capsid protein [Planctomycetia bacterium]